jgi:uncharacterized damage-inducible protein DinB
MGLLNHIISADLVWLTRFKHHFPNLSTLEHRLLPYQPESLSAIVYPTLDEHREARREVDELLRAFTEDVDEGALGQQFTYTNSRGSERTVDLGGAALHMFNHQTHHRGAIAQILDELDVENDYSNLLATVILRNRG